MPDSSQYTLQEVQRDAEFVLLRGHRAGQAEASGRSVLVRTPVADPPSTASLRKLRTEYDLRTELDPAYVVRPLSLLDVERQPMLILEDPGGTPLDLLDVPTGIEHFLRLAIGITAAIGHLHSRGYVHKDIKPANVLVNAGHDRAWLMGSGSASRVAGERHLAQPSDLATGTLAYMAPEQTGRMNRPIDSRSDLYSLGVTLYELLTGSLPFAASDPMEWAHAHLARKPVPPEERSGRIPTQISRIIMKLLAKTPEERYQTGAGVASDLRRCLADWQRQGWIDFFALAEQDVPDRLLFPEKLYGRAGEVDTLLECFERVATGGAPQLVLVRGFSGIGKSSIVGELRRALAPARGLFASGKSDQYKRDIPYATLAQAFQGLVRFLLGKSETELHGWRAALHEALGSNGKLIVDLVPDLQLIIGEPAPVPELPPQDAQRRFQGVLRRFIGAFARAEQPLVLFLDDLQWLDTATLDLIEDLLTQAEIRHLLLVGAYRDNEVDARHPLSLELEAIRNAGTPVQELELAPLTLANLTELVRDCLHKEPGQVTALAELIHEKTGGNPLFAVQFIAALVEEGLLTFDYTALGWRWDLDSIRAKGYTDNVVALMVGKLNRLSRETQHVLQVLACMGNSAELALLQLVCRQSETALQEELEEASRAGLVLRTERAYKFFHDRLLEAAYASIPEDLRAEMHLHIGWLLADHIPAPEREARIFEIVNQLNRGLHLLTAAAERSRCAELNLMAGSRAKRSTAYTAALTYLRAARALLTEESWDERYPLIFSIEYESAECELLTADMAAAERRLSMLAQRARRSHDIALVTRLRTTLYTTLDRSDRGMEVCLEYLRSLGTTWSLHPSRDEIVREYERIWELLGDRSIEELLDLPLTTDPDVLDVFDVLSDMVTPAHYCDANLPALILCRMVNLSLEYGNSDASCIAWLGIATIAGGFGDDSDVGLRLGQLGYDLVEKRGLQRFRARVYALYGNLIVPWMRPPREGRDLIRRGFQAANEMGDLTYAAYTANYLVSDMLTSGESLAEAQHEAEECLSFQQKTSFGLTIDIATTHLALIRTLRGATAKFGCLDAGDRNELELERHLSGNPVLAIAACWYWIRKLQARYFAGDYAAAVDASLRAERLLWTSPLHPETVEWRFYSALSHAAAGKSPEVLRAHRNQLDGWAARCPENFRSRAALVAAETARIEGRELDAQRLYEEAIRSARAAGFIHHQALSYELAARFYAARGFDEFSRVYLQRARESYLRWGAIGKVHQLEESYPSLGEQQPAPAPPGAIGAPAEHLDLATVIKVSRAVSAEMDLEKLVDTLMRTAIEHAGAERGLLILSREGEQRIAAEVTISNEAVIVQVRDDRVTPAELPESVLHCVGRTQEAVIIDDASAENPFSADPYIARRRARSLLCLPLSNRGKLIGALYLENNLAARIFAPARTQVLRLLASQAAISLENACLYRDLAGREARIRRLFEANVVGIYTWDFDGRIVDANEAFLHMLGYDHENLLSGRLRWTELTVARWQDRDRDQVMGQIRQSGFLPPFEWEFIRKDGSRVPVLIGAARFEDGNQGVAFVVELTELKRAGQALRQSEAYLAEAQRLTHTGSWAYNHVLRKYTYYSDEQFRIHGLDPRRGRRPELQEILALFHPEDRDRMLANVARIIREKCDYSVEYRIRLPDGTVRHLRSIGHPVLDEAGELLEHFGSVIDVTERRRAEHRLLAQHRVSLILAESSTLEEATSRILQAVCECMEWHLGALWRSDREACVLRCTELWYTPSVEAGQVEAIVRTSTYRPGQGLPGRVWVSRAPACIPDIAKDLGHGEDIAGREGFLAAFAFPILLGSEVLGVMSFVSRDVWVPDQDLLVMMATMGGQIGQFAERKRAESALQLAQSELAHVTRVMTMGELTASIAHEVNQPLGAIVTSAASCARWLAAEPPNIDKAVRSLARIVNDGKRASQVIGRIRALMKRQTPRKGWLDINETLVEVIALAQYELRRNDILLETRLARSLPLVQGDRVQLQQVLLNLIVNAIEAMSGIDGRRRELTLVSTTDGADAVAVEVRDSGTGVDSQFASHLFQPFYTTKAEGIGIGLSISRSIVEAHGGQLSASANEPHGAVFRFSLPVREAVS
jgi:PAS domain S-box-containing protein